MSYRITVFNEKITSKVYMSRDQAIRAYAKLKDEPVTVDISFNGRFIPLPIERLNALKAAAMSKV